MKIEKGFVAATSEGEFINVYMRSTHIGYTRTATIVKSIDDASVFSSPHFGGAVHFNAGLTSQSIKFVPVEMKLEVVLTGYGVNKS